MKTFMPSVVLVVLAIVTIASATQTQPAMPGGMPGMSVSHCPMMAADIKYEEVPGGVVLRMSPKDPAQLDEFRKQVQRHVEMMQKGECPMMQMHKMMHE